nr:hypothetical protein [Occallatibacter savannae]
MTDLVTAVPTETVPNASEVTLRLSEGVPTAELDPLSCIEADLDVEPWVAVRVTVCEAVTAATVAGKVALVAPGDTVRDAGTETAALLLAKVTASPVLGAAPLKLTKQLSVPAPIMEELEQLKPESEGVPEFEPFPCSLVVEKDWLAIVVGLVVVTFSVPLESVVDLALKLTLTSRLWPAESVVGSGLDATVKAVLELVSPVISIADEPGFLMEMV